MADKLEQLEYWANNAAQALQEFCDEAQAANGNPDGDDQLRDIRELIAELDAIMNNNWQEQIIRTPGNIGNLENL